jgi:D-alanyl-D-alanine carboxypeptidase/D-alanyl-D-alanine-endopeptidase (penicillin-binding protein 4)
VREIQGDIVLDGSAFAVPEIPAGDFDGEALRPYNVRPAALLLNYRALRHSFAPDAAAGVARVRVEPALPGSQVAPTVALAGGPCNDWRAALKASFEPGQTRFDGHYPAACGETTWQVADPQPASYDARLIASLWHNMGGRLGGSVRSGLAPHGALPTFEHRSPALAEVVRDINKFSNNVMAQQLFLTLALQDGAPGADAGNPRTPPATPQAARELLARWLVQHTQAPGDAEGELGAVVIDNGSGLSRETRISAARLARLLVRSWQGPVMSELMSSLPIAGLDGTLRRSATATGRAHLKTGALRDVAGLAGYALSRSGRRYALVAVVNHGHAAAARPALEALVQWSLHDGDQGQR